MYILYLAIALPITLIVSAYYSWATAILWNWFVVPIFGAPMLSTWEMFGIVLVLALMRHKLNFEEPKTDGLGKGLIALAITPLVSLGTGYLLKFHWM